MRDDVRATHAIRLGLREIKGLSEEDGRLIVARRTQPSWPGLSRPSTPSFNGQGVDARPKAGHDESGIPLSYNSVRDVWLRTGLSPRVLERLADADAFGSFGLTRREALWAAKALGRVGDSDDDLPLFVASRVPGAAQHTCDALQTRDLYDDQHMEWSRISGAPLARCTASGTREPEIALPPMPLGEEVVNDYRFLRLSLRAHPAQFLRADLAARGTLRNEALRGLANNTRVRISGLVTCRQRPGSAKGVVFMTIEDESAVANVIVWPKVFERVRPVVLGARYVAVSGRVQEESGVIHVVADQLEDLTLLLGRLAEQGADIDSLTRADEVRRPVEDQREAHMLGGRNRLLRLMREMPELVADLDVPAPGSAHAPTRHATRLLRHHLAAPDIDAVSLQRTIRLFQRADDGDMGARLELALVAHRIAEDAGIGRHYDLLLAALVFDHHHLAVDAAHRLIDGTIGHGAVRPRIPGPDGLRPSRAALRRTPSPGWRAGCRPPAAWRRRRYRRPA